METFYPQTARSADPSFFPTTVVGHVMFHVFKQRQATKNADQVAHKPIELRFVD